MKIILAAAAIAAVIGAPAIAGGESSGGSVVKWSDLLAEQIASGEWIGDCTIALLPEGVECIPNPMPDASRRLNIDATMAQVFDLLTPEVPTSAAPLFCTGVYIPPGYICAIGPDGQPMLIPVLVDPPPFE